MKLDLAHNFLETHGSFETTEFSIDDSAHAFELLLKNLYSDPIASCVRETISNAWDSHMVAGTPDTAIVVTAPTELEPTFIVQDFGIGISPDKFKRIVTRIFCSDKTNSDDVIGGYGLGLKSPLAYTDQFTITSIINGWLRNYSCHISESGKPMLSMFNEEPTTEGNGVTIKVPVKPKDIKTFQAAIKNTLTYFSSFKCNLAVSPHNILWENELVKVVNTTNEYGNNIYALVGCIPYKVDLKHITDILRANYQWIGSIILKFNINEISVTPNREELNYNEKTITALNNKYTLAKNAASDDLADKVKNCVTWELACKQYTRLYNTLERFGWVSAKTVSHPSKPGEGLSKFIPVVFDGYEVRTITHVNSRRSGNKLRFEDHFKEKLKVDITKPTALYWLPTKAKRVLECINNATIAYWEEKERLFIVGDNFTRAKEQFQDLYNTPIEVHDLSYTLNTLTPRTNKSYAKGNILTTQGPINISDINPKRDVYIQAEDKHPIAPWDNANLHTLKDVLPDEIRYIIYNHKSHSAMLKKQGLRDLAELAKQVPILIAQNMELIQRHKQLPDRMAYYINHFVPTKINHISRLANFANRYRTSQYVKDLFELAHTLNIDIPDNPTIQEEINTIRDMYKAFFENHIDLRDCSTLLIAYDHYLETVNQ